MSYQGQNPNQDQYPNSDEYGRGYAPQSQPSDPYSTGGTGNQYYQPPAGNQSYQPGNTQQSGNQYYQPGAGAQYQPPSYGQPPYNQQQYNAQMGSSFTTLGIDPRIESLLCYVLGIALPLGWLSGLIFFLVERKNRQVRFHAMQSIIVFGALSILLMIIGWIPLLIPLVWLVATVAWITLMILAYTNNTYRVPYLSDFADRFIDQIKI
jgi:uncharacterized membrane protein